MDRSQRELTYFTMEECWRWTLLKFSTWNRHMEFFSAFSALCNSDMQTTSLGLVGFAQRRAAFLCGPSSNGVVTLIWWLVNVDRVRACVGITCDKMEDWLGQMAHVHVISFAGTEHTKYQSRSKSEGKLLNQPASLNVRFGLLGTWCVHSSAFFQHACADDLTSNCKTLDYFVSICQILW